MEKKKRPILLIVAFIIMILTTISFSLVVVTYSRYISSKVDINQSVVAKFEVSDALEGIGIYDTLSITLNPGESKVQNIVVTNSGEVDVKYSISVINVTNNLPLTFVTEDSIIKAGQELTCQITIKWDALKNSPEFAGKTDVIRIIVTAEQVVSEWG